MKDYLNELERYLARGRKDAVSGNTKKYAAKIAWMSIRHLFSNSGKRLSSDNGEKLSVLVRLDGGVGDVILAVRYFYELKKKCGDVLEIDFLVKPNMNAESLLLGQTFFNRLVTDERGGKYDAVIRLMRYPEITYLNEKKAQRLSPIFYEICADAKKFEETHYLFFVSEPYHELLGNLHAKCLGQRRENKMDVSQRLNLLESDFALHYDRSSDNVLERFGLQPDRFITIQRGVGDTSKYPTSLTRLWSIENYTHLVQQLKHCPHFAGVKIVQIGSELSTNLEGIDFDLRGKTTFEELKALLVHARYHIDGEAGMVHMRHFLCKKSSVVIFGPTDEKFLGYPENINISKRPEGCPVACEWLTPYWREKCIVTGTGEAACQQNVTPETVIEKMVAHSIQSQNA